MNYKLCNMLICDFMKENYYDGSCYDELHKDWNLLMKVVERIESIHHNDHGYFGVYIHSNACTIQGTKFRSDKMPEIPVYYSDITLTSKIESTWHACFQFIEWYNKLTV